MNHDSPEVQAWVARFRGDGPPRIGARLLAEALQPSDEAVSSLPRNLPAPGAAPVREERPAETDAEALALLEKARRRARHRPARHPRGTTAVLPTFSPMRVLLILLLIATAMALVLLLPRLRTLGSAFRTAAATREAPARPSPATTPEAATPPVTVTVRPAALAARSGRSPALASSPVASSSIPTTPPATAATDSVAKPRRTTLEVASYLSVDRAEIERDRLIGATGLDGWVIEGREDGAEVYRVLLGIFSTPDRAESAATALLGQGQVSQARVVPLPPKRLRH